LKLTAVVFGTNWCIIWTPAIGAVAPHPVRDAMAAPPAVARPNAAPAPDVTPAVPSEPATAVAVGLVARLTRAPAGACCQRLSVPTAPPGPWPRAGPPLSAHHPSKSKAPVLVTSVIALSVAAPAAHPARCIIELKIERLTEADSRPDPTTPWPSRFSGLRGVVGLPSNAPVPLCPPNLPAHVAAALPHFGTCIVIPDGRDTYLIFKESG